MMLIGPMLEALDARVLFAEDVYPDRYEAAEDAPTARFESYNIAVGERMFVFGGFDAQFKIVPNMDVFDGSTSTWSTIVGTIPIAETHAGHAVDGSSIYFAGGFRGPLPPNRQQPVTKSVWRYDTATNTWDRLTDLPAARGGGSLVRVGRELHYFGGCLADRETNSGAHWMLRLGKSSGGRDDESVWLRRPAMPSPRDHFSAVAIDQKIIVLGGEYGHDVLHAQSKLVHSFDAITGQWRRLADMPVAKSHFESATFSFGQKVIAAGGQVHDYQPTALVHEFDLSTNRWSAVRSLPEPRQGGAVLKLGDQLIVAMGARLTNEPKDDVWFGVFRSEV